MQSTTTVSTQRLMGILTPEMYAFDGGHNPHQASHEALRQIREQLTRHPLIVCVEGLPQDTLHKELRAEVDPSAIGTATSSGTLTVRWYVVNPTDPVRFTFHYPDESSFDCGGDHHEQDHSDGWGHYQQQQDSKEYAYEELGFGNTEPARVVWRVLEELQAIVRSS